MSYTIAIASQKGGVAKTTSAISLGGAFVQAGNQVLLIDLDPQADLTLAMGLNPRQVHDFDCRGVVKFRKPGQHSA